MKDPNANDPFAAVPVDLYHLIPAFLERREKELTELEGLFNQRNFTAIKALGHKLKGTGTGYGFAAITEAGRELETAAVAEDVPEIRKSIDDLKQTVHRIVEGAKRVLGDGL